MNILINNKLMTHYIPVVSALFVRYLQVHSNNLNLNIMWIIVYCIVLNCVWKSGIHGAHWMTFPVS